MAEKRLVFPPMWECCYPEWEWYPEMKSAISQIREIRDMQQQIQQDMNVGISQIREIRDMQQQIQQDMNVGISQIREIRDRQQQFQQDMNVGISQIRDRQQEFLDQERRRRQKLKMWLRYIIAFVIFQTVVIALFAVTVMKFRTPMFRIRSAGFDRFEINPSNPSFNFRLNAIVGVKNPNFGTYKFDTSTIVFYYRGVPVGNAVVPSSKANFRSTKNVNVAVDLVTPVNVGNKEILATDLSFGILLLTSVAEMEGEVTILFFKKRKSAKMYCDIEINARAGMLQSIICK